MSSAAEAALQEPSFALRPTSRLSTQEQKVQEQPISLTVIYNDVLHHKLSILSYIQMLRKNQSPGLNQQSQLPPQSNVLILIFDMTRTLVQLLLTLSTLILQTLAGGCQLKEPDGFEHRPLLGQRWACKDPQLQFPTVACLARDILTCGKVKDNWCVFYSMGAKVPTLKTMPTKI
jgi:hypothetical protein